MESIKSTGGHHRDPGWVTSSTEDAEEALAVRRADTGGTSFLER